MKWIVRLGVLLSLPAVIASVAFWYAYQQYSTKQIKLATPEIEVVIDKGLSAAGLGAALRRQGVEVDATWLRWASRIRGDSGKLKAGSYELKAPLTLASLLDQISRGDEVALRSLARSRQRVLQGG